MKRFRQFASMLLALSLALSIVVLPAAAVEPETSEDMLEAAIMEYGNYNTYELSDGTTVIVGVLPIASTYDGYDIEKGVARPTASHNYQCTAAEGNYCRSAAYNIDENDTSLTATLTYDASVDAVSKTEKLAPGERLVMVAKSTTSGGLTGKMSAVLTAVRADSVMYSYTVDQYWA